MVARRNILALTLALCTMLKLGAQNYSASDTITEYPNKGTYYHDLFEGRKTSSGEIFDQNKFTAAHWKIKLGTLVMVTNKRTGDQVIVKINDRCPKRGVIDLTHRAAKAIGIRGMQPVTIRVLPDDYRQRWEEQDIKFEKVSSRLSDSGTFKSDDKAVTKKSATSSHRTNTTEIYTFNLGEVHSHTEAFNMIQKLPEKYRDLANIEPLGDETDLLLTLTLNINKKEANKLCDSLRPKFPEVKIYKK